MPAERHICFSPFRAVGQGPKPAPLEKHRLPATLDSFLQLLLSLRCLFFFLFLLPFFPPTPVGLFWVFEGFVIIIISFLIFFNFVSTLFFLLLLF